MTNFIKTTSFAAALALLGVPAIAQITPEQVVESLEGQGYTEVMIVEDEQDNSDADTLVATANNADGVAVTVVYNKDTGEVISATPAEGQTGMAGEDTGSEGEPVDTSDEEGATVEATE
ncbi:hypothetical protein [Paracoccus albus]|uniref:hypothetical protein n=1 Tax=Paracoccus albus TaxID=3017784 RepID=UPI0022F04BFD|nr:hypothetical protein [Paracoccus albus]WBU58983.1 hypothetical protein PAF20_09170 [Paracoccus albus]